MQLLKYADDSTLVARLTDPAAGDRYQQAAASLVRTFNQLALEVNISKTKESATALFAPLGVQGRLVEQVDPLRGLGTGLDNCLSLTGWLQTPLSELHSHGL